MSVSAATDQKIRAALTRLLNGEPPAATAGSPTPTSPRRPDRLLHPVEGRHRPAGRAQARRRRLGRSGSARRHTGRRLTQQRDTQAAKAGELRAEKVTLHQLVRVLKHEIAALVLDNENQQSEIERLRARIRRLEGGNLRSLPHRANEGTGREDHER